MNKPRRIRKKTVCPLDCPDTCGLVAEVENGKIVSLSGDKDHPYTAGVICRKMKNYPERVYGDKRILYPLKRVGKKGAAAFEQISWDEAYTILQDKIESITKQYGGEAILPFAYAGNMGAVNRFAGYPLFHKLGTSRMQETICSTAARAGWSAHCGNVSGTPPEVAEDAELIVIWGSNTKVTNLHFWQYVAKARKKQATIVVIDPYRNITAESADLYVQVNPAADSALALAIMKLMVDKGQQDYGFIHSSTLGFDDLKNYLDKTPLDLFVEKSGVDKPTIIELAGLLAGKRRTFIRLGIGMTRNGSAGMTIRSITSLAAMLGLFDGGAGRGVLLTSSAFKGDNEQLVFSELAEQETRLFNMVQLGNALKAKDPPVKMLFVYNANPLSVAPDSSLVREGLKSDDFFMVVHEQVMTPTARYGDLVLPATTFLENSDAHTAYGHFYFQKTEPVIEPRGEAKSNFTFFQELAEKLQFTDMPFQQSLEERIEMYCNSLIGLPERIKKDGVPAAIPILSTLHAQGEPVFSPDKTMYRFTQTDQPSLPKIPCLVNTSEFDDADSITRFPFKLITPPHMDLLNSTFGEKYTGNPGEVLIHPDDALGYSIKENDTVTLYNNRGWSRRIARISDATQQGLLVAEGIFWQYSGNLAGINDLTSQKLTDMGGGGTFHEARVAILSSE